VRHLFCVAASLDSMVLGESQIIGQVRGAYDAARDAGTVGRFLHPLFERALATAKSIQTSTGIGTGSLSVGSTAVDLARQIFSSFDDKTVMMVGAGKMGELTLAHLLANRPRELWITNRTDARAVELAERLARKHDVVATAVPYAQWVDYLARADILISSTGAREPILTAGSFAPIPERRSYRPLLIIDIAVPRDIEPAVGDQEGVFLYNIDDLQSVTEANLAQRREAVDRCHDIINLAVVEFLERQTGRDVGPLVRALREHFHDVGRRELERILPKLSTSTDADRELIEQMIHRIAQKLLHRPIHLLNTGKDNGAARVYADTLRALYQLDIETATECPARPPTGPEADPPADPPTRSSAQGSDQPGSPRPTD
jgi:glutamyl-tRNA reductase